MKTVLAWLKKDVVLTVAGALALLSMLAVPPDAGYTDYIDFQVLAVLFCLMAVVAGFQRCGLFDFLSVRILALAHNTRAVALLLVGCCFFSSMLITNDVALLTFVPLTLLLFASVSAGAMVNVVVLETAAANLGSALTPIGNPQNLYLYSFYNLSPQAFFAAVVPLCLAGLVLLCGLCTVCFGAGNLRVRSEARPFVDKKRLLVFSLLFAACVATVLHALPWPACLAIVLAGALAADRGAVRRVDWALLCTFAAFFVLVGNLGRIPVVEQTAGALVAGHELTAGMLLSQAISNVPAAIMLSHFTQAAQPLLAGVNLGGLGTPVASLASLIAYKL